MSQVGFETIISVFKRAKRILAFGIAATVICCLQITTRKHACLSLWFGMSFLTCISTSINSSNFNQWRVILYFRYLPAGHMVQCWGSLITSEHQLYRVTPLKTPFGLVIPLLQSQSHVTTITHNYFLAVTRLHNYTPYTFVTTITYSTLARLHSLRALHSNLYCTIAHKVS
jgi:hypothetical protein